MLKFESLQLVGFKSFADKLEVSFDDRVTAIVGPNGCGKSNLFDAVGWVLGAQSARNLRGEKMEDVIFSGTAKRKPSGFAQVTLTAHRDDEEPLIVGGREFTEKRLQISRKLYRDGQSVFQINEKRCRLMDIRKVLEEAGLGYASYGLIAQGRIESILTGKPADRRAIIEEAARISHYKSRRRNAEVKLEMAQQNLLRVNDIIQEVERSLRSLKRQAAKARRYQAVKQEFREVQIQKFALESQALRDSLETAQKRRRETGEEQNKISGQLADCEREHRAGVQRRDQLESDLAELKQQRSDLRLEIDRTENSIQYHDEQIESARKALEASRLEKKSIAQHLQRVSEELKRFAAEREDLKKEVESSEAELERHAELVERHAREIGQVESRQEKLRGRLLELSGQTASLGNLKEQLESRQQDAWNNRQRLVKEEASVQLHLEEAEQQVEKKRRLVEQMQNRMAQLRTQLHESHKRREELEAELAGLKEQENEAGNRLIAFRERLQSLQEVELNHSHYSEGVRKFLNHLSGKQGIGAAGTLADRIETSPQFERLVEEFLDEELEYVLVDSMDEALLGVSELRALKGGRCTFLSIRSDNGFGKRRTESPAPPAETEAGVYGSLRGILRMDAEVGQAFERVLPQHAEAIVVSDLDRAFNLAHSYPENTFITLEGETLTPRGLLSANSAESRKLGLLSLKRQKKQVEAKIGQAQKDLAQFEEKRRGRELRLEKLARRLDRRRDQIHQLEKDVVEAKILRESGEDELGRRRGALNTLRDEMSQLSDDEVRLRERIQQVEADLTEKRGGRLETEKQLAETHQTLAQLREEAERVQRQYHSVASDQKVLQERRTALARTLERIEEQKGVLQSRGEAAQQSALQSEERIRSTAESKLNLQKKLKENKAAAEQVLVKLAAREQDYERWKQSHPAVERRLESLRDAKAEILEKKARLDVERARLETQLQNVQEQCREQLNASVEEILPHVDAELIQLEDVSTAYANLRQRLETFGPVNMTALQEHQETEERHAFLAEQRGDIEASIADTMRAIQDLNRRSKEKFQEAFDAVNRHFQEFFEKLFGGGECGMQLLDEDDILESGLDIYAQPPGKKLQNVMLLSGGEKALTVLALLMGLFTYRPSRFCVLDEVDAPLDDANVIRFTNLVRELSEKTQLILVTHNKRTMETSDCIYGVTMAEPGVSQVVSVQF